MTQEVLRARTIDSDKGVLRFVLLQILALMAITYIPWFSMAFLQ